MKRGELPRRRNPLPRTSSREARPKPARRSRGRAPMPTWLADFVLERAGYRCDRCARHIDEIGFSRQHRRAHGMGGRAGAQLHTPGNVVVLCGSATTPGGCHNLAENVARAQCEQEGWVIRGELIVPEQHPALRHGVRWEIPTATGWLPAEEGKAA